MADSNSLTYPAKADQVSNEIASQTLLDLAKAALDQADASYNVALELSSILDAFLELENPPSWVFPLHAMARRSTDAADVANMAVIHLRGYLAGGHE